MKNILFILAFIFSIVSNSMAQYNDTIILAAEDNWIPYAKPDGTGMSLDIIREAYKTVGIKVNFVVRPYKRILNEVKKGKYLGGFNVPREIANEKEFVWGEEMIFEAYNFYFVHKDRPLKAKNRYELKNSERIGVILAYGYGDFFTANDSIQKEWSASEEFNLQKLMLNRLDAVIIYDKGANYWLQKMNLTEDIIPAFPGESTDIYVGFSVALPESKYYAKKLDEGIRKIRKSGLYKEILDHY